MSFIFDAAEDLSRPSTLEHSLENFVELPGIKVGLTGHLENHERIFVVANGSVEGLSANFNARIIRSLVGFSDSWRTDLDPQSRNHRSTSSSEKHRTLNRNSNDKHAQGKTSESFSENQQQNNRNEDYSGSESHSDDLEEDYLTTEKGVRIALDVDACLKFTPGSITVSRRPELSSREHAHSRIM